MKKVIGGWNVFELVWFVLFTSIAIGFTVFITGVLCVVLAAKGNLMSYVFGMYNTVGYAYLAYINGLFEEVMLNLLFFVPMNIVGFYMWKNTGKAASFSCVKWDFKVFSSLA